MNAKKKPLRMLEHPKRKGPKIMTQLLALLFYHKRRLNANETL